MTRRNCLYHHTKLIISLIAALLISIYSYGADNHVYIEIRQENAKISKNFYLSYTDVIAKENKRIKSTYLGNGVEIMDFRLSHPIYNALVSGGRLTPIYIEPGDSLLITVNSSGMLLSYGNLSGEPFSYNNLLRHDISNGTFYTHNNFEEDRKLSFDKYVEKLTESMNTVLQSVNNVADRYVFSDKERQIALDNVKMQYGVWLFEYAPKTFSTINEYARNHKEGWQSTQQEIDAIAAFMNVKTYSTFMQFLPKHDIEYLASKYFPMFIQSYEHSFYMLHDQYLYYDDTEIDSVKLDSAMMARDCEMMRTSTTSIFMNVIMEQHHYVAEIIDDDAIHLDEVSVTADLTTFYNTFGKWNENMDERKEKIWDPNNERGGLFSPITYFSNRKHVKRYNKAKNLLERM